MYSRKREKQDRLKGKQKKGNHEHYIMSQLERIDNGKSFVGMQLDHVVNNYK